MNSMNFTVQLVKGYRRSTCRRCCKQTNDKQDTGEHRGHKVRIEEPREEDGKRDIGEMRGAIAQWTPEGRVYFDNRYHRRRCYRGHYRSEAHTVNGQQIGRRVCVHAVDVNFSVCMYRNGSFCLQCKVFSTLPSHFLFTPHLSFSCRICFQTIMWLLYHK